MAFRISYCFLQIGRPRISFYFYLILPRILMGGHLGQIYHLISSGRRRDGGVDGAAYGVRLRLRRRSLDLDLDLCLLLELVGGDVLPSLYFLSAWRSVMPILASCFWQMRLNSASLSLLEESELISMFIIWFQMADQAERQFYKQFLPLFQMGNTNNVAQQLQEFYQHCHPALIQYQLDQKQQLLHAQVKVEQAFVIWRKLADPLFDKKYLVMPLKIVAPEYVTEYGCCAQEDFHRFDLQNKIIYYELFVFTLDREIASRRQKKTPFRDQQLWKIIKYLARAVLEWQTVYPLEPVGSICPFNVLLDPNGRVRLVCRLSFFNNEYNLASEVYSPPQSRENSIIKYSLNPSKDPVGIEASAIYGIGMVMLEALTLEVSGVSLLQTVEKITIMEKSSYGTDLKIIIAAMLNHNQAERPRLERLIQEVRYHKVRKM